jgi:signal transduction histidine kinase/CheY-like chemotaxis protein
MSFSYKPAFLAWLESRCLSGTLARKIAVVVCSVLALAVAVLVELDWHHDRAEETSELVHRVRADATRLAARIRLSDSSPRSARAILGPYAAGTSTLSRVDLVDRAGRVLWSTEEGARGKIFDARELGWDHRPLAGWLTLALAEGGVADASRRGDCVSAVVPIVPEHAGLLRPRNPGRGAPVALVEIWDESAEAASADVRRVNYHVLGLVSALTLGFLLWWLLLLVVSRPLADLAAAAGRADLAPEDLAPAAERDDEIGALARTLALALVRLEERRAQVAERTARLESALNAGTDGLAMASLRDGMWRIDHVNEILASLVGKPADWFTGRTVHEGMAAIEPRLVDPEGVGAWVEQGLADPDFVGMRMSAMRDPALLTELHTRPMRDALGRPFGRIWVVRDVTSARAHERTLTRQNQELAVLDLVGRRVSRSLEAGAILHAACDTLAELLEAHGSVTLPPEDALPPGELTRLAPHRLALPLADSNGFVAAIDLARPAGVPFADDDVALLQRVRYPIEIALENARLFARTEEQLVENQTLSEVSRSIGRADALDAVLSDILGVVCSRLQVRNAAILLPDPATSELYVRASEGYHGNLASIRLPIEGPSVTAHCFRTGTLMNVTDVRAFDGYVAGSEDIRSELALPLRIGERVLGILDLESDRLGAFGARDERLLTSVANQAAIVLWNASLFAEARARATRFEAINEIARAVSSTLDPARLDRVIVSQLARVVPCDRYAVLRYDHERRRVTRAVVLDARSNLAHDGDGLEWAFEDGVDPSTMTGNRAEHFPDLALVPALAEHRLVAQGMGSMVLLPIALEGAVQVAVLAASTQRGGFAGDPIRLLETVSYHVGVALKNAELFSRLQESYIQLNEAQDGLVRSEKLRALGEMASGVAHDFNNVLGAILGRAQLLKARSRNKETQAELGIIERAALDGASTVRRLQDFTRVRTDRAFEEVALAQLVEDCLSLTRGRWRDEAERAGTQYDVTTELAKDLAVAGQASELREVLTNLILNALDAMPRGGALKLVTRGGENADEVALEVIDDGEGMSDDVRARIFDPFFTTKGVRGVGLGLSVVYGIVQRHGGRIEVVSAPGKGTRMRVFLPALAGKGAGGAARGDAEPPAAIRPGATAPVPLRILVIDDEPSVRSLLGDLLRASGHRVVEAANGRDALQRMETDDAWDLVLTDLGMPDLSGWDVARAVAARPSPPPVILVTGWGIQLEDRILAESGVAAVVAKPFTIEEVLGAVERVLRRAA